MKSLAFCPPTEREETPASDLFIESYSISPLNKLHRTMALYSGAWVIRPTDARLYPEDEMPPDICRITITVSLQIMLLVYSAVPLAWYYARIDLLYKKRPIPCYY